MSEDVLDFELDAKNSHLVLFLNKMRYMEWPIDDLVKFDHRDSLWEEYSTKSKLWLEQNYPELLL
jgi:hypothetical protein